MCIWGEKKEVKVLVTQSCPTLCGPWTLWLLCPWNSPGKNTAVGSQSLLQRIFPTQGSNLGPPHCKVSWEGCLHAGRMRGRKKMTCGRRGVAIKHRQMIAACYELTPFRAPKVHTFHSFKMFRENSSMPSAAWGSNRRPRPVWPAARSPTFLALTCGLAARRAAPVAAGGAGTGGWHGGPGRAPQAGCLIAPDRKNSVGPDTGPPRGRSGAAGFFFSWPSLSSRSDTGKD